MKYLKIIIIVLLLVSCNRKQGANILVGKWVEVKRESLVKHESPLLKIKIDGVTDEESNIADLRYPIILNKDGSGIDLLGNEKFFWTQKDSILVLGLRKYIILFMSESKLVLVDDNEIFPNKITFIKK